MPLHHIFDCYDTLLYFKMVQKKVFFKCNISVKARDRKMDISIELSLLTLSIINNN